MLQAFRTLARGLTHNADGTFSSTKSMQVVGFAFVTWWLTMLVQADAFTEWYLLSYLVFPFGLRGLQLLRDLKAGRSHDQDESK
jgi:hypothetical protein